MGAHGAAWRADSLRPLTLPAIPVSPPAVLSANETAEAEEVVLEAMQTAMRLAEESATAFGDGTYTDITGKRGCPRWW